MNPATQLTTIQPQGAGAVRPNARPEDRHPAKSSNKTKSVLRKLIADDPAGYDRDVLPGLENTRGQPYAAKLWNPNDPPRWWVETRKTAKAKKFVLRYGSKSIRDAEGLDAFHQLLREADFLNASSRTPTDLTSSKPQIPTPMKSTEHHHSDGTSPTPERIGDECPACPSPHADPNPVPAIPNPVPATPKAAANRQADDARSPTTVVYTVRPDPTVPAEGSADMASPPSLDADRVDHLLEMADLLFSKSEAAHKELLDLRVQLGRVLIDLKDGAGHGAFMEAFKGWIRQGRIRFSLKTGQRAMAYAELERAGRFVDANNNQIVLNLADAERLRKAEVEKSKAQIPTMVTAEEPGEEGADQKAPATLTTDQIARKARQLATPLLEECAAYGLETKRALLEELIETLAKELDR